MSEPSETKSVGGDDRDRSEAAPNTHNVSNTSDTGDAGNSDNSNAVAPNSETQQTHETAEEPLEGEGEWQTVKSKKTARRERDAKNDPSYPETPVLIHGLTQAQMDKIANDNENKPEVLEHLQRLWDQNDSLQDSIPPLEHLKNGGDRLTPEHKQIVLNFLKETGFERILKNPALRLDIWELVVADVDNFDTSKISEDLVTKLQNFTIQRQPESSEELSTQIGEEIDAQMAERFDFVREQLSPLYMQLFQKLEHAMFVQFATHENRMTMSQATIERTFGLIQQLSGAWATNLEEFRKKGNQLMDKQKGQLSQHCENVRKELNSRFEDKLLQDFITKHVKETLAAVSKDHKAELKTAATVRSQAAAELTNTKEHLTASTKALKQAEAQLAERDRTIANLISRVDQQASNIQSLITSQTEQGNFVDGLLPAIEWAELQRRAAAENAGQPQQHPVPGGTGQYSNYPPPGFPPGGYQYRGY